MKDVCIDATAKIRGGYCIIDGCLGEYMGRQKDMVFSQPGVGRRGCEASTGTCPIYILITVYHHISSRHSPTPKAKTYPSRPSSLTPGPRVPSSSRVRINLIPTGICYGSSRARHSLSWQGSKSLVLCSSLRRAGGWRRLIVERGERRGCRGEGGELSVVWMCWYWQWAN